MIWTSKPDLRLEQIYICFLAYITKNICGYEYCGNLTTDVQCPAMDWSDYLPYFQPHEFDCRHCGANEMQAAVMDALYRLRGQYGRPIIISSGYRCPRYNDRISTTGRDGPHTTGLAADILVSGADARLLLDLASEFSGVGISQKGDHATRFVHLDLLSDGRPWVWSY